MVSIYGAMRMEHQALAMIQDFTQRNIAQVNPKFLTSMSNIPLVAVQVDPAVVMDAIGMPLALVAQMEIIAPAARHVTLRISVPAELYIAYLELRVAVVMVVG